MLKTRKEIFKWLLEKRGGGYDELIKEIGKEMADDLEVLGYIHKGYATHNSSSKGEISWGLTERGKKMAELIVNNQKKGEKKYSIADILKKILF